MMHAARFFEVSFRFFVFKFEWFAVYQDLLGDRQIDNILWIIRNIRIIKHFFNIKFLKLFILPHFANPLPFLIPPRLLNTHILRIYLHIIAMHQIILKPSNHNLIRLSHIASTEPIHLKVRSKSSFKDDSMIIDAPAKTRRLILIIAFSDECLCILVILLDQFVGVW